jgi:hypothetical protein
MSLAIMYMLLVIAEVIEFHLGWLIAVWLLGAVVKAASAYNEKN